MSARLNTEQLLDVWLAEGPVAMSDRVPETVALRIAVTPQHRGGIWAWRPRAVLAWAGTPRIAMVVAALLVVAALGFGLVAGGVLNPPAPTPEPTQTQVPPTQSPTPSTRTPGPSRTPAQDELPPGVHESATWAHRVSFVVPAGWSLEESAQFLSLGSVVEEGAYVRLSANVYPPLSGLQYCNGIPSFAAPHSALDLVNYLPSEPTLRSEAIPTALGNLQGWLVEVDVLSAPEGCDAVGLFTVRYPGDEVPLSLGSAPGLHWSLYVLEHPQDGKTIVVDMEATSATVRGEAREIVASLVFDLSVAPTEAPRGPLSAGTHRSEIWAPNVTYTVPVGWTIDVDETNYFGISIADQPEQGLSFAWNLYPPQVDSGGCQAALDFTNPHDARALVDYWRESSFMDIAARQAELGGLRGWVVEGEVVAEPECDFPEYVTRYIGSAPLTRGAGIGPMDPRYVLDDGYGQTVGVWIYGEGDPEIQSVIDSVHFASECNMARHLECID
jgi:hypothetical protein